MNKIIALRGIPCSWKSSFAQIKKKKDWAKIFNKDAIRDRLGITPETWSKSAEKRVISEERKWVEKAMGEWRELIVVDNTHLWAFNTHLFFYKGLAKTYNYEFEVKDFYCSRDEAIERDSLRERKVGVKVIDKMIKLHGNWGNVPVFASYREQTEDLLNAYIFDIDCTLAQMDNNRSPYDYSKVYEDKPNQYIINIAKDLAFTNNIIVVSWREDSCRGDTIRWLKAFWVPYSDLYMRKAWDTRKDSIVKKEIFENEIEGKYNIWGVFDDRDQVCKMWRLELKLPCLQVFYGSF